LEIFFAALLVLAALALAGLGTLATYRLFQGRS